MIRQTYVHNCDEMKLTCRVDPLYIHYIYYFCCCLIRDHIYSRCHWWLYYLIIYYLHFSKHVVYKFRKVRIFRMSIISSVHLRKHVHILENINSDSSSIIVNISYNHTKTKWSIYFISIIIKTFILCPWYNIYIYSCYQCSVC